MKKKKKSKRKRKKTKSKKKNKKITFKKKKTIKRKKKVKKNKKTKRKIKTKSKINLSKFKTIKTPKFNIFKGISFESVVGFILKPVFVAYENFREQRKKEKLKKIALEKKERERQAKEERRLRYEVKQKELRDEIKLQKEREHHLKRFLRQEQALIRKDQAEKRKLFLEEIKLNKKIEAFRVRELKEISSLEKLALKEQIQDYKTGVEDRIEKIKQKYALLREQKIKERVQALGVEISSADSREDLLRKEAEHQAYREKIELILQGFYRSANSLVFQLNKKFIPKHKSILRCIDRLYENSECFIRYDDSPDEDWLILIYLEDGDSNKGKIIVENKSNPERHETKSFETKEIFAYSDYLVDSLCEHIDREREKKAN